MGNEGRISRFMERVTGVGPQSVNSFRETLARMQERKRTIRFNYTQYSQAATKIEGMGLPEDTIDAVSTLLRTGMALSKDASDIVWERALSEKGLSSTEIVMIADIKSEIETKLLIDAQKEADNHQQST